MRHVAAAAAAGGAVPTLELLLRRTVQEPRGWAADMIVRLDAAINEVAHWRGYTCLARAVVFTGRRQVRCAAWLHRQSRIRWSPCVRCAPGRAGRLARAPSGWAAWGCEEVVCTRPQALSFLATLEKAARTAIAHLGHPLWMQLMHPLVNLQTCLLAALGRPGGGLTPAAPDLAAHEQLARRHRALLTFVLRNWSGTIASMLSYLAGPGATAAFLPPATADDQQRDRGHCLAMLSLVQGLAAGTSAAPGDGERGAPCGDGTGSSAAASGSAGRTSTSSGSGAGAVAAPVPSWDWLLVDRDPLRVVAGALDEFVGRQDLDVRIHAYVRIQNAMQYNMYSKRIRTCTWFVGRQDLDGELAEAFALTVCAAAAAAPRELRRDVANAAGPSSRVLTPRLLTALLPHLPEGPSREPLTAALQAAAAMLLRWQHDGADSTADAAVVRLLAEAARMTDTPLLLPRAEANALWRGCDNPLCTNFAGDSEAALEL